MCILIVYTNNYQKRTTDRWHSSSKRFTCHVRHTWAKQKNERALNARYDIITPYTCSPNAHVQKHEHTHTVFNNIIWAHVYSIENIRWPSFAGAHGLAAGRLDHICIAFVSVRVVPANLWCIPLRRVPGKGRMVTLAWDIFSRLLVVRAQGKIQYRHLCNGTYVT